MASHDCVWYLACRFGLGGSTVPAEAHPSSNHIVVIFVIGGVSLLEVERIQRALERACGEGDGRLLEDCKIVIGSNDVLSPMDVLDQILLC